MAPAVPLALQVTGWINVAVIVFALVLMLWAFIHASMQRRDAFAAIGGLQKQHWMGLLGVLFVLSLFLGYYLSLIVYIGIGAAAYYLLDTRRGLKDVSEGPW